jgi:FkbM family methyltransferase
MFASGLRVLMDVASRKLRSRTWCLRDRQNCLELSNQILGAQKFVAIDVGAANGLLPHWESLDGVANIHQIEPRADACRDLEAANALRSQPNLYNVVQTALSEKGGPTTLYVTSAPTGSSLLPFDAMEATDCSEYVDRTYLHPIVEVTIETETLGSIMERIALPRCDLIKLDVQGAELQILRGLEEVRRSDLLGVELEIGVHDLYPKEAGLEAVLPFMQANGLELFDVRVARVHRPSGNDHSYYQRKIFSVYGNSPSVSARIWEFDAVFFRRKSLIIASGDIAALRRMAIVYCTYNFFSEAYDILEKGQTAGILSESEATRLKGLIVELHRVKAFRVWLADTPGMDRWRRLMYRIAPRSAPRWCQYMYQNYPNG